MTLRLFRSKVRVPCTVTVAHDADNLEAHVELDGDIAPEVGDKILVHGGAVRVRFGDRIVLKREATLTRAGVLDKLATLIRARTQLTDLYEVSFSSGRPL